MKQWCIVLRVKSGDKWGTMVLGPMADQDTALSVLRDIAKPKGFPIADDQITAEGFNAMALEMIDRFFTK